ncbi:MAG: T9SS type A sorting domain-containing protein [Candidatus Desantisbacteria bacterium]
MYLIIAVIMFITCPVFADTNLLQNPGFESGNLSGWRVEGIATNGIARDSTPLAQAYFQPAQVIAHTGEYAAFNLTANFKRIGSIFSQEIDVLPETSYRIGFWALHGHPSQQVKIYPQILIDGNPIGSLSITGGKGYGTIAADYQQVSAEFVTGHEQQRVQVSFVGNAGGLALTGMSYDDFFVVCSQAAVNISPTAGISGTPVCISGWNYLPEEQVIIESGTTTTNENGAFSTTITIPKHTSGTLTITTTGVTSGKVARALFSIIPRGDYGDAPNSKIYPMNTGYFCKPDDFTSPEFLTHQAYFSIISHKTAGEECLGKSVSLEASVNDVVYDEDGVPNIEPYKGRADQDSDDGLILPVDLIPGTTNTVRFEVTLSPETPEALRYVNILFDWNQNGQWSGDEWAVRNQGVFVLAGESRVITSQEFLAGTNTGGCWMRLVLTREPVVGSEWDGGGDFEYGESEDYLLNIAPRCDLWIKGNAPDMAQLGQVITYHLEYGNQGQALTNGVNMVMDIPQGLTYLSDTVGTVVIRDNKLIWQIGGLYSGQHGILEANLRVEPWATTGVLGTASINSELTEVESANNVATWSMRVISNNGNVVISGKVIEGAPLADSSKGKSIPSGCLVKAMQVSSYRLAGMALTNASGEYTISGLVPGTYNDGVVNERDIFPIAVWWGKTEVPRDSNLRWQAQAAIPWDEVAATYADANGDGRVSVGDILPIGMNWGMTHPMSGDRNAPMLYPEAVDHARYVQAYQAMYDMIGELPETEGVAKIKQALQGFMDAGVGANGRLPLQLTDLLQNYPNPFNPECWIPYELSEQTHVIIRIYNISGQLIRVLDEGIQAAGRHISQEQAVYWDGRNDDSDEVASGVYFYQMNVNGRVMTKRAVVLK